MYVNLWNKMWIFYVCFVLIQYMQVHVPDSTFVLGLCYYSEVS